MAETGYDYAFAPQAYLDPSGEYGLEFTRKDGSTYRVSDETHIEMHANAAERQGFAEVARYMRVWLSHRIVVEPLRTIDEALRHAIASLPHGTCDISLYHFDEGKTDEHGHTPHVDPGAWGAKTVIYPGGEEVYGYGYSPVEALDSLAEKVKVVFRVTPHG